LYARLIVDRCSCRATLGLRASRCEWDNTLTGDLTWTDPQHFTFKLFETQADDRELTFDKAP
jgi:hypothetical protein